MTKELELRPITPAMADDWREHIVPELPESLAISFKALAGQVYGRLEQRGLETPRGSVTNAVLAMAGEGELTLTEQGNIRSAFVESSAA